MNDQSQLSNALQIIGKNEQLRQKLTDFCKEVEVLLSLPGQSIRDVVTGPIIDALYQEAGILHKELDNGVKFDFYYRSKIARDIVMTKAEKPDHLWEPQTTKLLLHLSRDAKNVLVGGAYFGDHAILIARQLTANGGICHAFEPNLDQPNMLRHNAELNNIRNIKSWPLGLWSNCSSRLQLVGDDSFAHPEIVHGGALDGLDEAGFQTVTIDAYVEQQGIDGVDLIMLDIEGAEFDVLQGARKQLEGLHGKLPNIVFEVHRHYVDWSNGLQNTKIVKYLASFGYHVYAVRDFNSNVEMKNQPVEIIPVDDVYLEGPPHGFNMLAVKDESILRSDFFRICHGVSPKLLLHKAASLHQPAGGL